jgi:predicted Zn-ribbon and HTH transcriptional regulator
MPKSPTKKSKSIEKKKKKKKKKKRKKKRYIVNDSSCPICGLESESTNHNLWSCPYVMNVWGANGKIFQKSTQWEWEWDLEYYLAIKIA